MIPKTLGLPLACFALGALALGRPQQDAQAQNLSLAGVVPEDVFLYTYGRHNPERAFLDAYWGEVWQAFQASGITEDLVNLALGAADEEQRAVIEGLHERIGARIRAVDWGGLVGGEVAFAERMPPLQFLPGGGVFATPEYVVLFRPGSQADVDAIHTGIDALIGSIVDEVRTLAGVELQLDRRPVGEVELVTLDMAQMGPDAPSMPLTLGRNGNMVFFSFGSAIQADVVALMNGTSAVRPIQTNERMRAALAQLPAPEDELVYFDMQNLCSNLDTLLETVFEKAAAEAKVEDSYENVGSNAEAVELRSRGFATYQAGDHAEALRLTLASLEIDPTDSIAVYNVACLHALLGDSEQALAWLDKAVEAGFYAPKKIADDGDFASLRDEPRFKAALERAREHAGKGKADWLGVARNLKQRLIGTMGILECSATVTSTDGHSTYSESVAVLVPNAEQNAFYEVLASAPQLGDFASYVPREATSFSVDAGLSVEALYAFIEDTVRGMGAPGEEGWKQWEDMQLEADFDLREDLLSWLGTASVQATLDLEGGPGWIFLMDVADEEAAREGLDWALEIIPEKLGELAAQAPPLAMLQLNISDTQEPELAGFYDVGLAMMPVPMVCGVRDGWMMMGSSQDALLAALHTAAGEHESVRSNEALMAKALVPDGPFQAMKFTDHTGDAEEAAAILGAVTMGGGMVAAQIPEPEARQVVMQLLRIAAKLGPVVGAIDFYDSSASVTQFDGKVWRTRSVTHYVPRLVEEEIEEVEEAVEGGK